MFSVAVILHLAGSEQHRGDKETGSTTFKADPSKAAEVLNE